MAQDLQKLLKILLENKIDLVLIGGFSSIVHGATIVTQDLDICAAITDETVAKLRDALKDFHPIHRMNPSFQPSFLEHPRDIKGTNNIYLKTDIGVLDILSEVPPAGDFETIKQHSIAVPLYGHVCNVISLDDLIKVKSSMSRPKDRQTLLELLEIKKMKEGTRK